MTLPLTSLGRQWGHQFKTHWSMYVNNREKKNRWLEMFKYTLTSKDFGNSLIQSHQYTSPS